MSVIECRCSLIGQEWLRFIKEIGRTVNPYVLDISGMKVKFTEGFNNQTDIFASLGDFQNISDSFTTWQELAEEITQIYSLIMQVPPEFTTPNFRDQSTGKGGATITLVENVVVSKPDANTVRMVESFWPLVKKPESIINAIYYYHNAVNERDSKRVILELCKVVESILGYPTINELGDVLGKLKIDNLFCEIMRVKCLRNNKDSAHATEKIPISIKIESNDIQESKDSVRQLINCVINYLGEGYDIESIYHPWGEKKACVRCNCKDCPF